MFDKKIIKLLMESVKELSKAFEIQADINDTHTKISTSQYDRLNALEESVKTLEEKIK